MVSSHIAVNAPVGSSFVSSPTRETSLPCMPRGGTVGSRRSCMLQFDRCLRCTFTEKVAKCSGVAYTPFSSPRCKIDIARHQGVFVMSKKLTLVCLTLSQPRLFEFRGGTFFYWILFRDPVQDPALYCVVGSHSLVCDSFSDLFSATLRQFLKEYCPGPL